MTQDQNWPFRPMTQDQNQTSTDADTCTSPRPEDDLADVQVRELRDLYGPGTNVERSCNRALCDAASWEEYKLLAEIYKLNKERQSERAEVSESGRAARKEIARLADDLEKERAEIYKLNKELENEFINLHMELDTTRRVLEAERAEIYKLNKELENESINRHTEIARLADDLEKERAENAKLRAALVTAEQRARQEGDAHARLRNEIADERDAAVRDLEHEKAAAAHLVRERDAAKAELELRVKELTNAEKEIARLADERDAAKAEFELRVKELTNAEKEIARLADDTVVSVSGHWRESHVLRIAREHVAQGLSKEAVMVEAWHTNRAICRPPLSDVKVMCLVDEAFRTASSTLHSSASPDAIVQATATEGAIYRAIRAEIASAFRALAKVSGRAVIGMDLSKVAAELEAK